MICSDLWDACTWWFTFLEPQTLDPRCTLHRLGLDSSLTRENALFVYVGLIITQNVYHAFHRSYGIADPLAVFKFVQSEELLVPSGMLCGKGSKTVMAPLHQLEHDAWYSFHTSESSIQK